MRHLRAVNQKARRIEDFVASQDEVSQDEDVVALQGRGQGGGGARNPANPLSQRPHVPLGCSLVFSPGWEVDSAGGTAGLCQPVEREPRLVSKHNHDRLFPLCCNLYSVTPKLLPRLPFLCKQRTNHLAMHIRETPVNPVVTECKAFVVDAQ